ncbi:MAG: rRNA maturation RNase YbeY [Candidatus Liptonbacteria bacterium RIFOXYC1_FULL_36_8]|uniref:Endoribonuclease YbeY n=3 Tax=Candidatus Liptoniibacteriota TaxID=1817909 RepID=A0A1G2CN59_9BACT|nr:MAG: rRNA maturation RNase YbeY [Candidatus Liptonbacteria bacterium RIFOXYB1_FULL_36_10]OGZ03967.1 MAG: rRNA maturation RNase YbeY [Candidatus Liptonbacteria bacterium RIFOXYC1_FULL_36_8]OGZ04374.1 MAG: rRNA maturation RNase YbeY [Candidatus Liptonbacteria bacterium RIFOXYD1_FULL_36_11]
MVKIYSLEKKFVKFEKEAKKVVKDILDFLLVEKADLEVFFVSDQEIKKINWKYRKKEKPTNILSFSPPHDFPEHYLKENIGEVYLAPDFILKEGGSIKKLLAHGILHLLGFDHKKKEEAKKMEKKEEEIVVALGF